MSYVVGLWARVIMMMWVQVLQAHPYILPDPSHMIYYFLWLSSTPLGGV